MKEIIFRADGIDYLFDSETRKWYAGDREKSTSFIGSLRIEDESSLLILADMILKELGQERFSPKLEVGRHAFAVRDLSKIIERAEGRLKLSDQGLMNFAYSITGPIEVVYKEMQL